MPRQLAALAQSYAHTISAAVQQEYPELDTAHHVGARRHSAST